MTEDDTFRILKRTPLREMTAIMNRFHASSEYSNDGEGAGSVRSAQKLKQHGWDFTEYCKAIGTM